MELEENGSGWCRYLDCGLRSLRYLYLLHQHRVKLAIFILIVALHPVLGPNAPLMLRLHLTRVVVFHHVLCSGNSLEAARRSDSVTVN